MPSGGVNQPVLKPRAGAFGKENMRNIFHRAAPRGSSRAAGLPAARTACETDLRRQRDGASTREAVEQVHAANGIDARAQQRGARL